MHLQVVTLGSGIQDGRDFGGVSLGLRELVGPGWDEGSSEAPGCKTDVRSQNKKNMKT